MEFLIFNMIYKLLGLLVAFFVIWLVVGRFRAVVLKEETFKTIKTNPTALAIYQGLLFIGMVLLANKVIP